MFETLDFERVSSFLILFVALGIVGGYLIEQAQLYPGASDLGILLAGVVLFIYFIGALIYVITNPTGPDR
jgi:predicted membrane channel-forming protein YqfA (hemolysin III family)